MEKKLALIVTDDEFSGRLIPEHIKRKSKGEWEAVSCTTEKKLKKFLRSKTKFEVALVDLRLEKGFKRDGWSIARDLKEKGVPVSIVTAALPNWQAQHAKELGIPAFQLNFLESNRFSHWDALKKTVNQETNIHRERGK